MPLPFECQNMMVKGSQMEVSAVVEVRNVRY